MAGKCAVPKGVPKTHRDKWESCGCPFCEKARELVGKKKVSKASKASK